MMSDDAERLPAPRKDTRFKKGQSGNPRGRPRKPRRVPAPSQIRKDILTVRDLPMVVKLPEGEKVLTLSQGIYLNIARRALTDRVTWARMWVQLERDALQEQYDKDGRVRLLDLLAVIEQEKAPDRDDLTERALDGMLKAYKRKL
jgi:hypothetical protein